MRKLKVSFDKSWGTYEISGENCLRKNTKKEMKVKPWRHM
jgi:hypothetical protein